jgi:hypothetical protein
MLLQSYLQIAHVGRHANATLFQRCRLASSARVARSVSATTMYDVCIRADAKSASAGASRQPSQVEQVGRVSSDRVGWCRRLGSPARCRHEVCIRADAKSASAGTSGQPSEVSGATTGAPKPAVQNRGTTARCNSTTSPRLKLSCRAALSRPRFASRCCAALWAALMRRTVSPRFSVVLSRRVVSPRCCAMISRPRFASRCCAALWAALMRRIASPRFASRRFAELSRRDFPSAISRRAAVPRFGPHWCVVQCRRVSPSHSRRRDATRRTPR